MPWGEQFVLQVPDMDRTHQEFVDLCDRLMHASDAQFAELFAQLLQHTREHFEQERVLMRTCRFPATGEHESEHLRVLGELNYFSRALKGGRIAAARHYAAHLPSWFSQHLATMDSALAACLRQQLTLLPEAG